MNIKFTDTDLFESLKQIAIERFVVGSHMYGFNDKQSDIDYLYILPIPNELENDLFRPHHQLQFKEQGVDHIFVFIDTFLKNLFNGDSTINFEVVQTLTEYSKMDWLIKYKQDLQTYTVMKSYLGMAKRDIKYFPYGGDLRSKQRKLKHITRGLIFAEHILHNSFDMHSMVTKNEFVDILSIENDNQFSLEIDRLKTDISSLRNDANNWVETGKLNYFLPIETQLKIMTDYKRFLYTHEINPLININWLDVLRLYYDCNLNGLKF